MNVAVAEAPVAYKSRVQVLREQREDAKNRLSHLLSQNNNTLHVRPAYAKSGMSCKIQCYIPIKDFNGELDILDVTYLAARSLGIALNQDGTFALKGGGMCMAFEACDRLGYELHGKADIKLRRMS